jgi:NADH-quinone oxidoreductase subunit M
VTIGITLRAKVRRFSFARALALEALLLATLGAREPWTLIVLLGASALPLVRELRAGGLGARVLLVHHGASVALLAAGWLLVSGRVAADGRETWGFSLLAAGVAVRAGLVPAHCWVADLFERASLGTALLTMTPLAGAYAAARLLAPAAPSGVLVVLAWAALGTAVYSAAMSAVERDARRFLCYVLLAHSSLVLAGIALATPLGVTGGLYLWLSVPLSVAGLGLTLRSLEARTGRLSLGEFSGLHAQMPTLAALFLVFGLATAGFPGTVAFFGTEMLTDAASRTSKLLGIAVVLAAAFTGIAVVRAYAMLFLGTRHRATVDLRIRGVELAALLVLVTLLVGGTLWPGPGLASRAEAAAALLGHR